MNSKQYIYFNEFDINNTKLERFDFYPKKTLKTCKNIKNINLRLLLNNYNNNNN